MTCDVHVVPLCVPPASMYDQVSRMSLEQIEERVYFEKTQFGTARTSYSAPHGLAETRSHRLPHTSTPLFLKRSRIVEDDETEAQINITTQTNSKPQKQNKPEQKKRPHGAQKLPKAREQNQAQTRNQQVSHHQFTLMPSFSFIPEI